MAKRHLKQRIVDYLLKIGITDKPTQLKKVRVVMVVAFSKRVDMLSPKNKKAAKRWRKYLDQIPQEEHKDFSYAIAEAFEPQHYATIK